MYQTLGIPFEHPEKDPERQFEIKVGQFRNLDAGHFYYFKIVNNLLPFRKLYNNYAFCKYRKKENTIFDEKYMQILVRKN